MNIDFVFFDGQLWTYDEWAKIAPTSTYRYIPIRLHLSACLLYGRKQQYMSYYLYSIFDRFILFRSIVYSIICIVILCNLF